MAVSAPPPHHLSSTTWLGIHSVSPAPPARASTSRSGPLTLGHTVQAIGSHRLRLLLRCEAQVAEAEAEALADPSPSKRSAAADQSDGSDFAAANYDDDALANGGETLVGGGDDDAVLDLREAEVLSSAELVSVFPVGTRRTISRLHPSVLAVVAADRAVFGDNCASVVPAPAHENISHGQLQVLAAMLPDNPSLSNDPDKPSSYVCTVPPLMEGRGGPKQFYGKLLVVPRHSDWFSPATVNRLERQVVPYFFSGKSLGYTPEKYITLRNKVIVKYLERPTKRLAFAECQGLVTSTAELYDLSMIVRFLDTWGIINYLVAGSVHWGLRLASSLNREDQTGELQLASAPLKSICSLVIDL